MDIKEEWKRVHGFEDEYAISNLGRVVSFKKDKKGKLLSNKNSKGGYLNVVLISEKNKKSRSAKLHRLVAEHFLPNPEGKPEIHHKDGNVQNNMVTNLMWVTHKENMDYGDKVKICSGMIYYNQKVKPKKVQQYTLDGVFVAEYDNCAEASRHTGVCGRNIHQVARKTEFSPGRARKQAGGFVWKYKEE